MIVTSTAPWLCAAALDDDTLRIMAESREIWSTPWLRQVQLQVQTECRHRRMRIWPVPGLADRAVADRGSRIDHPSPSAAEAGRREAADMWLRMVERQEIPVWTERGPPDWLEATLWAGR